MISETTGAWMMVVGLVYAVGAWIWLRWQLRRERGQRLWRAWRAAARGNPWRNELRKTYCRCSTCWHMISHPDDPACKGCCDGNHHWARRDAQ